MRRVFLWAADVNRGRPVVQGVRARGPRIPKAAPTQKVLIKTMPPSRADRRFMGDRGVGKGGPRDIRKALGPWVRAYWGSDAAYTERKAA